MTRETASSAQGATPPSDEHAGSTLLQLFAETAEAVAATSRKLEKAALLGEYFHLLPDADLTRAARYFAGHQFAMNDARTTNVGGSLLAKSLSEATGFSLENLSPRYVRLGDAGDVAAEVIVEARGPNTPATLTLAETESLLATLSETRGTLNKQRLLVNKLERATPLEAKYLIKLYRRFAHRLARGSGGRRTRTRFCSAPG